MSCKDEAEKQGRALQKATRTALAQADGAAHCTYPGCNEHLNAQQECPRGHRADRMTAGAREVAAGLLALWPQAGDRRGDSSRWPAAADVRVERDPDPDPQAANWLRITLPPDSSGGGLFHRLGEKAARVLTGLLGVRFWDGEHDDVAVTVTEARRRLRLVRQARRLVEFPPPEVRKLLLGADEQALYSLPVHEGLRGMSKDLRLVVRCGLRVTKFRQVRGEWVGETTTYANEQRAGAAVQSEVADHWEHCPVCGQFLPFWQGGHVCSVFEGPVLNCAGRRAEVTGDVPALLAASRTLEGQDDRAAIAEEALACAEDQGDREQTRMALAHLSWLSDLYPAPVGMRERHVPMAGWWQVLELGAHTASGAPAAAPREGRVDYGSARGSAALREVHVVPNVLGQTTITGGRNPDWDKPEEKRQHATLADGQLTMPTARLAGMLQELAVRGFPVGASVIGPVEGRAVPGWGEGSPEVPFNTLKVAIEEEDVVLEAGSGEGGPPLVRMSWPRTAQTVAPLRWLAGEEPPCDRAGAVGRDNGPTAGAVADFEVRTDGAACSPQGNQQRFVDRLQLTLSGKTVRLVAQQGDVGDTGFAVPRAAFRKFARQVVASTPDWVRGTATWSGAAGKFWGRDEAGALDEAEITRLDVTRGGSETWAILEVGDQGFLQVRRSALVEICRQFLEDQTTEA